MIKMTITQYIIHMQFKARLMIIVTKTKYLSQLKSCLDDGRKEMTAFSYLMN